MGTSVIGIVGPARFADLVRERGVNVQQSEDFKVIGKQIAARKVESLILIDDGELPMSSVTRWLSYIGTPVVVYRTPQAGGVEPPQHGVIASGSDDIGSAASRAGFKAEESSAMSSLVFGSEPDEADPDISSDPSLVDDDADTHVDDTPVVELDDADTYVDVEPDDAGYDDPYASSDPGFVDDDGDIYVDDTPVARPDDAELAGTDTYADDTPVVEPSDAGNSDAELGAQTYTDSDSEPVRGRRRRRRQESRPSTTDYESDTDDILDAEVVEPEPAPSHLPPGEPAVPTQPPGGPSSLPPYPPYPPPGFAPPDQQQQQWAYQQWLMAQQWQQVQPPPQPALSAEDIARIVSDVVDRKIAQSAPAPEPAPAPAPAPEPAPPKIDLPPVTNFGQPKDEETWSPAFDESEEEDEGEYSPAFEGTQDVHSYRPVVGDADTSPRRHDENIMAAPARKDPALARSRERHVFDDGAVIQRQRYAAQCPVVFVIARKGGVGKSTMSAIIAQALASLKTRPSPMGGEGGEHMYRVTLIDANRGQGDIAKNLRVHDAQTIVNFASTGDPSSAVLFPPQMDQLRRERDPRLEPLMFSLIAGPPASMADHEYITSEVYAEAIAYARSVSDFVIVDTQIAEAKDATGLFEDVYLPLIYADENAYVVGLSDYGGNQMENLRNYMDGTEHNHKFPPERSVVFLNKAEPRHVANQDHINIITEELGGWSPETNPHKRGLVPRMAGVVLLTESLSKALENGRVPYESTDIAPVLGVILSMLTSDAEYESRGRLLAQQAKKTKRRRRFGRKRDESDD